MQLRAQLQYLRNHEGFRKNPIKTVMRLMIWKLRCSVGAPAIVPLETANLRIYLLPQWRGVAKLIYVFRHTVEPELSLLPNLLSPGTVFLDVGASLGIYTLTAARLVGARGRVVAIEPASETLSGLHQTLKLNDLSNVRVCPVALSDKEGQGWLNLNSDPSRNSLVSGHGAASRFEKVRTTTVDKLVKEEGLERLALIKIDVEGAEDLVLQGARDTLRRFRPCVLFELNEWSKSFGLVTGGASSLLAELGFRFFTLEAGHQLQELKFPSAAGNYLAVHHANENVLNALGKKIP